MEQEHKGRKMTLCVTSHTVLRAAGRVASGAEGYTTISVTPWAMGSQGHAIPGPKHPINSAPTAPAMAMKRAAVVLY